jgi:hypothetical protein
MAAPLTGHALVFAICAALFRGAILMTPKFSVGPYRLASDRADVCRFVCLDTAGAPKPWHEEWSAPGSQGSAMSRVYWQRIELDGDDWTAFGAASSFVDRAGEDQARIALARYRGAAPSGKAA